ncbi:MAG: hypothetical protein ACRDCW_03025 [Sarcina sp.]
MKGYYDTPVSGRLLRAVNFIYDCNEGLTDEDSYSITLNGMDISDYLCEDAAEMMERYAFDIIDASINEFDTIEEAVMCLGFPIEDIKAEIRKYGRKSSENDVFILRKNYSDSERLSKLFILLDISIISSLDNNGVIIDLKRGIPNDIADFIRKMFEDAPPQALTPEQKIDNLIKKHGASNVYSILSLSSLGLD